MCIRVFHSGVGGHGRCAPIKTNAPMGHLSLKNEAFLM